MLFKKNLSLILQDNGGVIYNTLSDNYYGLDQTGTFICHKINTGLTIEEISIELAENYEVDLETSLIDVKDFINTLYEKGLLKYDE